MGVNFMEVKEFVKMVLKDVTEAVAESNNDQHKFYMRDSINEGIDFDLAVVMGKTAEGKIGAEIFSVGAKAQGSLSEEVVNRIKFKVWTFEK